MKQIKTIFLAVLAALSPACGQSASNHAQAGDSLLTIREQGSFLIGGTVKTQPGTYDTRHPLRADGQTLHGDHAYVSYQIPADARRIPLVFLHGAGQSAKTWESTPDGREGFATLFLRRGFSTYLIDQPRRGRAGRGTADETVKATPDDQFWFENFRMGVWPHYYQGSQFPRSAEALEQFFRQMTPNTGAYDEGLIATDVAALMDKTGGGILVTHSQGGGPGWHAAIKSANVRAVVSYEPGSGFVFPEGETPQAMQIISPFGALTANTIPPADFKKLTRIPIVICYGGYIPDKPSDNGGGNGQLEGPARNGAPFCPMHRPPRRRRHSRTPARAGHQGQLPLPLCREEQCAACRPAVRMACRKGLDRPRSATLAH